MRNYNTFKPSKDILMEENDYRLDQACTTRTVPVKKKILLKNYQMQKRFNC